MQTFTSINNVKKSGDEYAPRRDETGSFFPFEPVSDGGGDVFHDSHRRRSPAMDYRIAIHEAGHVTVGRALEQLVGGSTINPTDNYSGATWGPNSNPSSFFTSEETIATCAALSSIMPAFGEPRDNVAVELVQTHARVVELLAGTEAERLLYPDEPPLDAPHDVAEARAHASLICCSPAAVEAFLTYARIEASELIREHRHIVQAIAAALIEHRTLDGAQIDAIISDAIARQALLAQQAHRAAWSRSIEDAATFEASNE